MTSSMRDLKVYTTYPHSCSYLEDQEATTLFVDPRQPWTKTVQQPVAAGFPPQRQPHLPTPLHPLRSLYPGAHSGGRVRAQARTAAHLAAQRGPAVDAATIFAMMQAFELYQRYIELRHSDGDMYPPDREQYESFLNNAWDCTRYYRFYDRDKLLAVAVVDELVDGLSAIYTFFEPERTNAASGTTPFCGRSKRPAKWAWIICIWATGFATARKWPTNPTIAPGAVRQQPLDHAALAACTGNARGTRSRF